METLKENTQGVGVEQGVQPVEVVALEEEVGVAEGVAVAEVGV